MTKLFISCKESRIENNRNFYGCFSLGPFESGQSLTIANALRRTLLSECSGLAIVSVLIENVHHEYSTLPGVRDSVLDILLNLKEIVLKKTKNVYGMYKKKSISSVYEGVGSTYFKPVIGYLKVRGPGVIRAKDLRLPSSVQCVDPNQYIATLSDDGLINMKFIIMEGKNNILSSVTRDSDLFTQRQKLINELKMLMKVSDQKHTNLRPKETLLRKVSPAPSVTNESSNSKKRDKSEESVVQKSFKDNLFQNSTQLFLDAIFNPVTKVNYVVEVNENKLVEKSSKKYTLTEDITNLMNSNNELKNAFPFLYNHCWLRPAINTDDAFGDNDSGNIAEGAEETLRSKVSFGEKNKRDSFPQKNTPIENQNRISEFVDHFFPSGYTAAPSFAARESKVALTQKGLSPKVPPAAKDDFMNLYSCIKPLKKEKPTNTIILEIWTNGSLHPREALKTSFNHLANLFLLLQKTKTVSPIYRDWSSYKNVLNAFINKKGITATENFVDETEETSVAPPKAPAAGGTARDEVNVTTPHLNDLKHYKISTLNISLRSYTKLKREKINTIGDLILKWPAISHKFDKKATNEILKCLNVTLTPKET